MPNNNYQNGRAREYRVKKRLEYQGWYCIRSAGSKGVIDIVCLKDWQTRCFQVKPNGKLRSHERPGLKKVEEQIGYPIEVTK